MKKFKVLSKQTITDYSKLTCTQVEIIDNETGEIYTGIGCAKCSGKDNFSHTLGSRISFNRGYINAIIKIHQDIETRRQKLLKELNHLAEIDNGLYHRKWRAERDNYYLLEEPSRHKDTEQTGMVEEECVNWLANANNEDDDVVEEVYDFSWLSDSDEDDEDDE